LLDLLGVKYALLPTDLESAQQVVAEACQYMQETSRVFALVIQEDTFATYTPHPKLASPHPLTREEAIIQIVDSLPADALIVSTTGKTSRELFEYRAVRQQGHQNDFLMVGAMGLASSLAAELALQRPNEYVYLFDGDSALMMSAGNLATIGMYSPKNLLHIVFDNACHESTGGQPSTSPAADLSQLALANSYRAAVSVDTAQTLAETLPRLAGQVGPQMLVVKIKPGSRKDLGRPTTTPVQNRLDFMRRLGSLP
jgi:phosphonopyruvate decarboxylase